MSATLILRDPDDIVGGRRRDPALTEWNSLLAKARSKPGRWWEVVPEYDTPSAASNAAYDINARRTQSLPEGRWEATSRTRYIGDDMVGILFVKFVGD